MKHRRFICQNKIMLAFLILFPVTVFAETLQEMNTWTYHKEWDSLSNINYSLARSPLPKRGLYDNLRLEIICKDNKLRFSLDANSLITSQGNSFNFDYQVDKKSPVAITMRTYKDTKRRGYTDENVQNLVADILSGQSIFIRVHTLIRTVLSGAIPMQDAKQPIQQVLSDCGMELSAAKADQSTYSLADFEQEIKTLSPEQQREVLGKIKEIMRGIR